MKYLNDATEIAAIMEVARGLKALTSPEIETLAEYMEYFEDGGQAHIEFVQTHHFPDPNKVNKEIDKLRSLIERIASFIENKDAARQAAIHFCAGNLDKPKETSGQDGNLRDWLLASKAALTQMPPQDVRYEIEPEDLPLKTKVEYKTHLIGFALPELFSVLYGQENFGQHNNMNDYNSAGIAFVHETSASIGFDELSFVNISKAIERCRGRFSSYIVPF